MRWWVGRDGRRLEVTVQRVGRSFQVAVDGRTVEVELEAAGGGLATLLCPDRRSYAVMGQRLARGRWRISMGQADFEIVLRSPLERELRPGARDAGGASEIRAPIPGKVVSAAVKPGDRVTAGQTVLVLEAMKMENQIVAESGGCVEDVLVSAGTTVEGGQLLVVVR